MTRKRRPVFTPEMEEIMRDFYAEHGARKVQHLFKRFYDIELDVTQIYDKASAMGIRAPRKGKPAHARSLKGESPYERSQALLEKQVAKRDAWHAQMMRMRPVSLELVPPEKRFDSQRVGL